jgi:alpha-soluble NSF attachment protein
LANAEKAVKAASGGFSLFGGKTEKWESAAGYYTEAANGFRLKKDRKRRSRRRFTAQEADF